ncbi:hypothetical protein K8I28_04740 [bacterium]|nr:hypothetical protein [bacterium]
MPALPILDHPLRTHEQVIERAHKIGQQSGLAKVVVAAAEEDDVLAALYACKNEGIADAILVGNPDKVNAALKSADVPDGTFEMVETESDEESAVEAAKLAGSGEADVVMKGFLKTSTLLKTILKHDYGLRDRELVTHSAVLYIPRFGKLLNITDGGTLIKPTVEQQFTVIANAYRVMRSVGIDHPKFAVYGPDSEVHHEMHETTIAQQIVSIASENWSEYLAIEGPSTIRDIADTNRSPEEQPDVLIVPTIEAGNITAKTLIQFGGAIFMGVIAGAKVPISLVSRSDTMINKKSSIALAVCLADYQKRNLSALPTLPQNISTEKKS